MGGLLVRAGLWGLSALGLDHVITDWFRRDGTPKTPTAGEQVASVGKGLVWVAAGAAAAGAAVVVLLRVLKGKR